MNEELYNRIDRYLSNALSEEERKAFETEVREDPGLREALRLQVRARYASQQTARKQQHDIYRKHKTGSGGGDMGAIPMRQYFAIAAVLLVLFTLTLVLLNYYQGNRPDTLYEEYFTQSDLKVVRSGKGETTDSLETSWNQALEAYAAGDFEGSAQMLASLLAVDTFPHPDQAHLYLGIAYLKLKQPQEAIGSFSEISPDNSALHYEQLWFTALAYLALEDLPMARATLEQLKESRSYGQRAGELLERLP